MHKIARFLLARNGHAALCALLATLLPLIGLPGVFFASMILGLVTLCRGARAGLFVLAWIALPALALLYLGRFGDADILLLRCILIWLLACVLRSSSWNRVLELITLIGVSAVVFFHGWVADLKGWWLTQLTRYFSEMDKMIGWTLTKSQSAHLIERLVPVATGILAFVMLLTTGFFLFLARWWQKTTFAQPEQLQAECIHIRNHYFLILAVMLGGVLTIMGQPLAIDAFPVLLLPLMIGGLSVMHFLRSIKKNFLFFLILIYLSLLLLPLFGILLLASVGFFDACFDLRKRLMVWI